jgi:hypothetical protein
MSSNLYHILISKGLLIDHEEVSFDRAAHPNAYKIIKPRKVPFISHPYEWSFSQLKDAALLTLQIQRIALEHGMTLKDGTAHNVQFLHGRPVFIDTLSFEKLRPNTPWTAYEQYCRHFLAPLSLMSTIDLRLNILSRFYLNGLPLDLVSSMLTHRSWLRLGILFHIHLHARSISRFQNSNVKVSEKNRKYSIQAFEGLIENLEGTIHRLKITTKETQWENYYVSNFVESEYLKNKISIVKELLKRCPVGTVWDFGANTGLFSRLASEIGNNVISFDVDPGCVDRNYREVKRNHEKNILPLVLDIVHPSPSLGWMNEERASLLERGSADTVIALALIHHLAISNNISLDKIASFFSTMCTNLIIEFVPKEDANSQMLLMNREDVFSSYTVEFFENEFKKHFEVVSKDSVPNSKRILFFFKKRSV